MFPQIKNSNTRTEVDRRSWPELTQIIMEVSIEGSGVITTDPLVFPSRFEGKPFFSYGVELGSGETLLAGDYPFVSVGVESWETVGSAYSGATLFIRTVAASNYRLNVMASFEGKIYKNPQYL